MCRQVYCDFVGGFGTLNPYELEHLSNNILVKFEDILVNRGNNEKLPLSVQDIKYAITKAMRDIQIEMAESCMEEAKRRLDRARADTFTPHKVSEAEVHRLVNASAKMAEAVK